MIGKSKIKGQGENSMKNKLTGMTQMEFDAVWSYARAFFGPDEVETILRPIRNWPEWRALKAVSTRATKKRALLNLTDAEIRMGGVR